MEIIKYLLYIFFLFFFSEAKKYTIGRYAVVTNYPYCSVIAKKILQEYGGNGYDAAIGIMLCEGVAKPQDMGLGGGFLGIIKPKDHKAFIINAREQAPLSINLDTYDTKTSSRMFGKTIGIPTALTGYATLKRLGKLSWHDVTKDVVEMARNGFQVNIGNVLKKKQYLFIEEMHRNIFINPDTQQPYDDGEIWKRPDLADTIEAIGKHGLGALDNGTIQEEINKWGGIITDDDFKHVRTKFHTPLTRYYTFNNKRYKLETIPLPGGGPSIAFILRMMELYLRYNKPSIHLQYVLIESWKYAFAFRSEYGDPQYLKYRLMYPTDDIEFVKKVYNEIMSRTLTKEPSEYYFTKKPKFDTGTANIVVRTPTETICITSSINLRFGSGVVSKYGFVYNNQLSDFSLPTRTDAGHLKYSHNNFPEPLKTPLSSMSCSIISERAPSGRYYSRYVLGAAGGPKIITSITQVLMHIFAKKMDLHDAIRMPRCHHQLIPNMVTMQKQFYYRYPRFLRRHNYSVDPVFMQDDYSAVTGIQIHKRSDMPRITASFDPRRWGGVEIWY